MTNGAESPFQRAISNTSHRGLGACALLAWVAASGGSISQRQHQLLRQFADVQRAPNILEIALEAARELDTEDLMSACEAVREMSHAARRDFLQWAFCIATSDNRLAISTNYVLRFLADLTNIDLREACRQAKKNLPPPGDPSLLHWWRAREKSTADGAGQGSGGRKSRQQRASDSTISRKRMSRAEAVAILGLGLDASPTDIAQAFRRLANIHHPDRYSQAGPETQRTAAKTFAQIRAAFEALSQE